MKKTIKWLVENWTNVLGVISSALFVAILVSSVAVNYLGNYVSTIIEVNDRLTVENSKYVNKTMTGLINTSKDEVEIEEQLDFWKDNKWDAQLNALETTCNSPDHLILAKEEIHESKEHLIFYACSIL